mmetsp:Transcript_46665/g.123851  ORF Transcript_46665/g.123851 Transcript_46665/m.123851 type:complete len:124 (-) Transcript_46665:238-609(-)
MVVVNYGSAGGSSTQSKQNKNSSSAMLAALMSVLGVVVVLALISYRSQNGSVLVQSDTIATQDMITAQKARVAKAALKLEHEEEQEEKLEREAAVRKIAQANTRKARRQAVLAAQPEKVHIPS